MAYIEHLKSCKIPTLHSRQIRGDMIEIHKILLEKYDAAVIPQVNRELSYVTRQGCTFSTERALMSKN